MGRVGEARENCKSIGRNRGSRNCEHETIITTIINQ